MSPYELVLGRVRLSLINLGKMKSVLFLAATLFAVQSSSAQLFKRIGMQQGVSYSFFEPTYSITPQYGAPSQDHLIGYSARAFADLLESRYFRLSPGLGFFQLGSSYENNWSFYPGATGKAKLYNILNYATFDIAATGQLTLGHFVPYIFIGPRVDRLLNSSSYFLYYDVLGNLNKTRYGLRYGAGLAVKLKALRVSVDWAGLYSFNEVIDESDIEYFDNGSGRTQPVTVRFKDSVQLFTLGIAVDIHPATTTTSETR